MDAVRFFLYIEKSRDIGLSLLYITIIFIYNDKTEDCFLTIIISFDTPALILRVLSYAYRHGSILLDSSLSIPGDNLPLSRTS
jgi:hypothetical protein